MLAALGSTPLVPASWTVPAWFVDSANATTCASNTNSGTAATCSGGCSGSVCPSGIGPLVLATEIVGHRWGTPAPVLAQDTTITFVSTQTLNQENINLAPIVVQGASFALLGGGTLTGAGSLVASFTLGVVTPKNRATPQNLTSTGFVAAGLAVGQLVVNTSQANSRALIQALGGGTATLSQPLAPLAFPADASNFPVAMPAENDSWTTGDTVQVYKQPLINLKGWNPNGGGHDRERDWRYGLDPGSNHSGLVRNRRQQLLQRHGG